MVHAGIVKSSRKAKLDAAFGQAIGSSDWGH